MFTMRNADKSVKPRIRIERKIVRKVISDMLKAGFWLSVDDGEEESITSRSQSAIESAIMNTDEDRLYIYTETQIAAWKNTGKCECMGWVFFVYGNSGFDVISDYTTNLEEYLQDAEQLANQLEEGA